jgi:cytochrome c oxidase subunit 1
VYLVFFPMHYLGIAGFPRRYYSFTGFEVWKELYLDLTAFITIAAAFTAGSQLIFLWNFIYSIFRGRRAPQNPWRSNTLEWTAPINPGHGNWVGEIPAVYRWPYDYSKPGAKEDYIPQNIPLSATPESNLAHEIELTAKGSGQEKVSMDRTEDLKAPTVVNDKKEGRNLDSRNPDKKE